MKKRLVFALIPTLLSCLMGCRSKLDGSSDFSWIGDNMDKLALDTSFENGFNLLTTSTNNGRALSGVLNYGGEAKSQPKWLMAQWWTHNDFINSTFNRIADGEYEYTNDSRHCYVNTKKNLLQMDLNSNTEYQALYSHSREGNEQWSHFLLEQNFDVAPKVVDLQHLYVHLQFTINKSVNMDPNQKIPCAQFLWYFTVTHAANGNTGYESGDNDFFWFGVPIYDSRYDYVPSYQHVDSGFVGATNKLIYCLSSQRYLDEEIQIGKKYEIALDILPYIKAAFIYGNQNGAMPNSKLEDLVVNYMNIGLELPGSYDISVTIENLDVAYEIEE